MTNQIESSTDDSCAHCGHDADLHALDGRGVTPEPYCEHEDGCTCPRYTSKKNMPPEPVYEFTPHAVIGTGKRCEQCQKPATALLHSPMAISNRQDDRCAMCPEQPLKERRARCPICKEWITYTPDHPGHRYFSPVTGNWRKSSFTPANMAWLGHMNANSATHTGQPFLETFYEPVQGGIPTNDH